MAKSTAAYNALKQRVRAKKFTKPRATLEEVLVFCNMVREAGGGNPLDALMPAVPASSTECLIAKNLNFNCSVGGTTFRGDVNRWVMVLDDVEVRNRIAASLNLAKINLANGDGLFEDLEVGVILPKEVGRVAEDFDQWRNALAPRDYDAHYVAVTPDHPDIDLLREFGPYIEASVREANTKGIFNKKGELIL